MADKRYSLKNALIDAELLDRELYCGNRCRKNKTTFERVSKAIMTVLFGFIVVSVAIATTFSVEAEIDKNNAQAVITEGEHMLSLGFAGYKIPNSIASCYLPSYLPEDCEFVCKELRPASHAISWETANNEEIIFKYYTHINYKTRKKDVDSYNMLRLGEAAAVHLKMKNSMHFLLWVSGNHAFSLYVPQSISDDELVKIAKSVAVAG